MKMIKNRDKPYLLSVEKVFKIHCNLQAARHRPRATAQTADDTQRGTVSQRLGAHSGSGSGVNTVHTPTAL